MKRIFFLYTYATLSPPIVLSGKSFCAFLPCLCTLQLSFIPTVEITQDVFGEPQDHGEQKYKKVISCVLEKLAGDCIQIA